MSVLIKGMEMPECCDVCTFSDWSNLHQTACCKLTGYEPCFDDFSHEYNERRSDYCPLVELPEKHGDLIDKDVLKKDYGMGSDCNHCETGWKSCGYDQIYSKMDFCGWIDDTPVVIEAEGEG